MTDKQMIRSLRSLTKSFAWKALIRFSDQQQTSFAIQLLSMNLDSPEARKLQGYPLGMVSLLTAVENLPEPEEGEDDVE